MRHFSLSRASAWAAAGLLSLGALASQAQTSNLPAPTGSPSNTIAQASGSNVVVDLTQRQGYNVPASLFGVSCGHLTTDGKPPLDYHSLNDPALQAAIQSMSFGLVRLNWDLNATMDYIFGGSSVSFASVDNFINNKALFGLPGKPLIITMGWPSSMNNEFRYGTPSAKTLATYQEECRQVAAYFKSKGLSGIYWALGNEVNPDPDPYPIANLVTIFNAMQAGIYQSDGTAQCGGITDSWRNDGRLVSFVQGANPKPKFLDWHGYWGNISETDDALLAKAIDSGTGLDKLRTDLANAGFARNLPIGNTEFNVDGDWQNYDARNGNYYACVFAAIVFHQQITHDHAATFAAPWDLTLDSTFGMIDGSGNVQPLGKFITRAAQALPGEACAASVGTSLSNLFVLPTVNGSGFGCMITNASSSDQTISLTINGLSGSSFNKTEHSAAHPNGLASTVTASAGSVVTMTLPAKSVCVLSGSGTTATTPTPTAGIVSGGVYKLLARHSGMALDVDGGGAANETKLQQWTAYDNNPNQEWRVDLQTDGTYTLTHNKTNACLDTKSSGTNDGTVVWQYAANNSDAQRWEIKPTDNGYYKLLHKGTNKCLDVDGGTGALATGTKVQLWEFVGGQNYNQQWKLQLVSAPAARAAARAGAPSAGAASANAPAASALSVYPNPAEEQLTVSTSLAQAGAVQLSLHDQVGRLVRTRTQAAEAGAQTLPLDLRGLPAGLYLLRVQQPGRPAQTRKVTVQP